MRLKKYDLKKIVNHFLPNFVVVIFGISLDSLSSQQEFREKYN
jgi:peroxiredoxin